MKAPLTNCVVTPRCQVGGGGLLLLPVRSRSGWAQIGSDSCRRKPRKTPSPQQLASGARAGSDEPASSYLKTGTGPRADAAVPVLRQYTPVLGTYIILRLQCLFWTYSNHFSSAAMPWKEVIPHSRGSTHTTVSHGRVEQSSPGNIESWGTSCFTFLITASTPSVRDVSWKRAANLCEIFIRSFALPALSTLPNPWEIFFFFLRGVSLNFLWPSRFREQAVESLTNATLKPYVWAQLCKIILCRLLTYKGYFCFPTSLNWHEQILNLLSRGTGLQQRKHWDSICCQLSM